MDFKLVTTNDEIFVVREALRTAELELLRQNTFLLAGMHGVTGPRVQALEENVKALQDRLEELEKAAAKEAEALHKSLEKERKKR